MATFADSSEQGNTKHPTDAFEDGPVAGALLPMVWINGKLFVVPNALHFYYPAITERTTKPRADGGRRAGKDTASE